MSLMKLLSVSRSFVNGKQESGRYRMAEQGMLPKFAPVGRQVSLAPQKTLEDAPSALADGVSPDVPSHPAAHAATALAFEAAPEPLQPPPDAAAPTAASSAAAMAAPAAPALCVNAVPASTNWFRLRRNPFSADPTEPVPATLSVAAPAPAPVSVRAPAFAAAAAGASRAVSRPVQSELSLDAVKPVRNDLSDADLEVVPAPVPRSAGTLAASTLGSSARWPGWRGYVAEKTGPAWSRLTARWFGSERARV